MAQLQSNVPSLWPQAVQAITWVIVIIGWLIVNHQNNQRERRKEIRQAIDKIVAKIDDIERSALTFHQTSYNENSARELMLSIEKNNRSIARLQVIDIETYNKKVIPFRRSITLKNFDPSAQVALNGNDPQLASISTAAQNLIDILEDTYAERYLQGSFRLKRFNSWFGSLKIPASS